MNRINAVLSWIWANIEAEPVAAQNVVHAILVASCAFGLGWSGPQVAAVSLVTAAVLGFLTRRSVTPNAKSD